MNAFELIALIGFGIFVYVMMRAKHFSSMSNGTPEVDRSGRERELEREVEDLRERIHVLERIATDKGAVLAQQIEDLRGVPTAATQFEAEERR